MTHELYERKNRMMSNPKAQADGGRPYMDTLIFHSKQKARANQKSNKESLGSSKRSQSSSISFKGEDVTMSPIFPIAAIISSLLPVEKHYFALQKYVS